MKISEKWLRQWANPNLTAEQIGEQLTMAGLELDDLTKVAKDFSGVVIGEVLTCEQHPDADKLKVTTVNVGEHSSEPLQIVCGAPNVAVGVRVPVALVGAKLPPAPDSDKPFVIKKGKLRGVESQGMLCGGSEIDCDDGVDGLLILPSDAPIGVDIREYLSLDNQILDISITPNRGDCFSVRGIARELAVLNGLTFKLPFEPTISPVTANDKQAVTVETSDCPRYFAQVVTGLNGTTASPDWLRQALMAVGVKPRNLLVDVTNYVLFELGQPLHAFDKDKIVGSIIVRHAKKDEKLTLLNEQEITLHGDELVIADEQGVIALAGIMGGLRTAVTDDTVNVVIESAYFAQLAIAGKARRFGLHTDASQRFERGVDFELPKLALDRAVNLLATFGNGQVGEITLAENVNELPTRVAITLPIASINQRLGADIATDKAVAILNQLEINSHIDGDNIVATPPSHRFDINIPEDLVEEIGRIYGYDNIPAKLPNLAAQMHYDDSADLTYTLKQTLSSNAYFEAVSFSFSDAKIEALFNDDKLGTVLPLANPISSELAVMRRTLLSSLLPIVSYNLNRRQDTVRLFETGLAFVGDTIATLTQTPSLALVAVGNVTDSVHGVRAMDFYDLKGDIERLLPTRLDKAAVLFERADLAFLHPYQSAYLTINGVRLGWFGQLHPSIAKTLDLPTVWVAQLALEPLLVLHRSTPTIIAPSKFPVVRRDLAFLVDTTLDWQSVANHVRANVGENLTELKLFDVYQGEHLPAGKKSLAFSMTFNSQTATLADETIKGYMDTVIDTLTNTYHAQLRDS